MLDKAAGVFYHIGTSDKTESQKNALREKQSTYTWG